MGASTPVASKANGLTTVVNVITSPREAFETLRVAPTWGWAFLIACVLVMVGQYLATPAVIHAVQATFPQQVAANPALAGMSPEKQQQALNTSLAIVRLGWVWSPIMVLIASLIVTVIMLIFKAAGRGDASFKQLWCAAVNVGVVSGGVSGLVNGLIAMVRGPGAYNSTNDAYMAMPSLAWLAPHAGIKVLAFLSPFSIIGIWGAVLVAMAMMYVAKTSKANAAACAVVTLAVVGAFLALGAR